MNIKLFLLILSFFQLYAYGQCPELETLNLKKTALIIGEKNYLYANPLTNTINDARDIADSLKKIGFDVNVYTDADLKAMNSIVDQWCSKLSNYNVALFYYSGHAAESNSENYLFPIDANPKTANEMASQCLSANALLSRIDNSNVRFNIMILDACRSNPFAKSWVRDFSSGGLAAMTGKGTFIGYAAAPGKTASDGSQRNGTYTEAILKYITIPGLTIDQIFTRVNSYVRTATKEIQIPFKNSSLSSDYCFCVKRSKQNPIKSGSIFMQPPSEVLLTNDQSYLINITDSGISIKDALTLNNLQTINTNRNKPIQIASKTGENIIVVDSSTRTIFIIDVVRKIITGSIKLDHSPTSIVLSNFDNKVYVSFEDTSNGGIYILDLNKNKITEVVKLNCVPVSLALSNDDKNLFILSLDSLILMDANSEKIIKRITIIDGGKSLGLTPDNKTILVGAQKNNQGRTLIFDANTLKLKKTLEIKSNLFSFTLDNLKVLAINLKELFIIDLKSLSIINRIPFNSAIKGVAISADGVANIWLPLENRFHIYNIEQLVNNNSMDPEIKLTEFKESAKKDYQNYLTEMEDGKKMRLFFDTLTQVYENAVNEIKNDLGNAYDVMRMGNFVSGSAGGVIGFNYDIKAFGNMYGIVKFNYKRRIDTHYIGQLSSDEFTLQIYEMPERGNAPEIYRVSRFKINWTEVKAFIRKYFLNRLDQLRENN